MIRHNAKKIRGFKQNFLLLLLLLVQFALLGLFAWFILVYDYDTIAYALAWLFVLGATVVIFFRLIYSQEDIEFKIPWLVILLVLPGLGVLLYITFKQRGLRKKDEILYKEISVKLAQELPEVYLPEDYEYRGNFALLTNVTGLSPYNNSKVTYFKCGEEFFPDFLAHLEEAKEFIFLEFFIIHFGKWWGKIHEVLKHKAAEGVEVRLLYDDFGCVSTLPRSYWKELRKEGILAYPFGRLHLFLSVLTITATIGKSRLSTIATPILAA